VINLLGLEVREAIGCSEPEAGRILRLVGDHQTVLMEAWRRYHG
jgi:hypothetical protein